MKKRWKIERMRMTEKKELYKDEITKHLAKATEDENIDEEWSNIERGIEDTADNFLGKKAKEKILRKNGPTLFCFLILELAVTYSQNDRSYDTSDWIPISQPCRNCKDQYASASRGSGRVLNLPEQPHKRPLAFNENRNIRQANNYQQYLSQSITPPKQKNTPNNKNYAQQTAQYKGPQEQRSAAQLQQDYTNQHLLPNIDLITRQVLQQTQTLSQQSKPVQTQNINSHQTAPQIYNPALFQQNLLKQSYPNLPQQFSLPQHLRPQQAHLYQQQDYLQQQQQPQKLPELQLAQPQSVQSLINSQQPTSHRIQEIQNQSYAPNFYESSDIHNVNDGLVNGAGQSYQSVDITSTTPKSEKENVQLLYVPLEHLQQKQQRNRPSKIHRQKQVSEPLKQENLLESIEKDFIEQALQAHKLQQQFDQQSFHPQPVFTQTQLHTTTLKPISRKRKPHQPPLAVYMNGSSNSKVTEVLNVLKDAKAIDVQDTIGPESPHVFVGPANLDPPEGFSKFDLPYLSNIESNRIERKVDQLPFFVAPLNYNTPPGYSKIPFPSPHVGSVVVNNELGKPNPLDTVPSVQDFLNPYDTPEVQSAPFQNIHQETQTENVKTVSQEATPTYYVRKPSRTRGRQQNRSRTKSVAQTTPNLVHESSSYNVNSFPGISTTTNPNTQAYTQHKNVQNVEINNPSLNVNNQLKSQTSANYFPSTNIATQQQRHQRLQKTEATTAQTDYLSDEGKLKQQSNFNYFSEVPSVTPVPSVQNNRKQQVSTPKYFTDFEIIPSISSTIAPYNDKHGIQEFLQQFENLQGAIPNLNTYESNSNPSKNQNIKQLANDNIGDIYSIIPTVSTTEKNTQNDRRYLPLDSQVRTPAPQIDYDDLFQLPLGVNQVRHNQKQPDVRTEGTREVPPAGDVLSGIQENSGQEKYAFLEEYPVRSSSTTPKQVNPEQTLNQQHLTAQADYQEAPVRKPSTRQRTRGRPQGGHKVQTENEHIPRQESRTQKERHRQHPSHENYNSVPIVDIPSEQILRENKNNIQSASNINVYENNFDETQSSPLANPVLPGLINSLEDASIRQLLTPILLAPPVKSAQLESTTTNQPIRISTSDGQISYAYPSPKQVNYNYDHSSLTTSQPSTSTQPITEVETTTRKRQRGRGRGRYNDRTTTNSPRRNPQRTRTTHPSRSRYRQETTTQTYIPVKQSTYTTTTETSRKNQPRQRFRTRGRPAQSEHHSTTTTARVNLYRIPETTTLQLEARQEIEPEVEIQHPVYAEQPIKKPQLITRSKILTPEEEYLVNKYNLEVSSINDPVTEDLTQQYPVYNEKEESLEQKIGSSKTITIQQPYPTISVAPVTSKVETTTTAYTPTKETYLSKHNIERNLIRTERPPVKIRTRIRGRKITQRPTTTSTTSASPPKISSVPSVEDQQEEFYGFIRQPSFTTKPATTEAVPKSFRDNSLYAPIIINSSPSSNLYEDDYIDTNEDGIQIFTNNQQSPSSPVHFIGELLPKITSSEKYYEATHEPLPTADKYISIPITTVTALPTTTTEETKRRGRLPSRARITKPPANRGNTIQTGEELVPRTTQRTRGRGTSHFKLPSSITTEQSSGPENYPQSYLSAKDNKQQYTVPIVRQQTEKPAFQITIDPDYGNEDQEPYSSILRPRVLPPNSNENHWIEEAKTTKYSKDITDTTASSTGIYETSTSVQEDLTTAATEENSTPKRKKKRGYWKLVKLRKITDDFEVAESQNVGVVSINNYNGDSNVKENKFHSPLDKTDSHMKHLQEDFDYIYPVTTKMPENETDLSETSATTMLEASSKTIISTEEVPTTATPITPEEIETTTTGNQNIEFMLSSKDNSDLDDVTIDDDDGFVDFNANLGIIETSTSISTEISHKTEICYKGVCEKMTNK